MATVYPTAAGNWSTRTWNNDATGAAYGTTPQTGDTVLLNNLTITVDQNITVVEVSNRAGTTAAAGGTLSVANTANGMTLNANVVGGNAASSACLTFSSNTPNTFTINGNVSGGSSTTARGVNTSGTGILTINGNVTGGSNANCTAVRLGSGALVTINGESNGGSGSAAEGVLNASTIGQVVVNGRACGGSAINANGVASDAIFTTGYTRVQTSKTSTALIPGHRGTVTFLDSNAANIVTIYDTTGTEHNLQKSSGTSGGPTKKLFSTF